MPSFDDSPPPNKKRKTIVTYGGQSMFSRALRAVRDTVPATLLTSAPQARENHTDRADGAGEQSCTLESPTPSLGADHSSSGRQSSSKVNRFPPSGGGDKISRHDNSLSDHGEIRISKRVEDADIEATASISRKRQKQGAKAESQGREEPSVTPQEVKGPTSKTTRGTDHAEQHMDEHNGIVRESSESADTADPLAEENDRRTQGRPVDERPRRHPKRCSIPDEGSPIRRSTPRRKKTPKTPTSIPGRKRGRPRKTPITSSTLFQAEENELGFRKITTIERTTSHNSFKPQRTNQTTSGTRRLSKAQAGEETNQQSENREESYILANMAAWISDDHGRQAAQTLKARSNPSNVQQEQPDDILRVPIEPPTLDPNLSEALNKSTTKLRKLLKTCPAESFSLFKSELLAGLTGKCSNLVNLDEEYRKLHQLVAQTVLAGEGNSMLLIGPRGCGKTTLVESVISDLAREHQDDFLVIRLSGFIHTDDKLALREIWSQLGREVAAENETTGIRTNYADTLTSLLALLAHSSEDEGNQNETARSVVFVIDEFDLFASHPRQTLLYNLFDVAQSRNAPIAVLGLTTRIDVVESLEKRVKSRFGQRYLYLSHPKNFSSFQDTCKSALVSRYTSNKAFVERFGSDAATAQQLRVAWNECVDALFAYDIQLDHFLRRLFAHSNCVATFKSSLLVPISLMSPSHVPIADSSLNSSLLPSESKLQLLASLSDLELSLLIAAARLDVILDTNQCNFAMVYDEYVQLASYVKLQSSAAGQTAVGGGARVWGKDVARGAWERLMDLELILDASTGSRSSSSAGLMCRVDVALEEIAPSIPRIGATMSKWCKEI
ncbi:MAG: hypothetical protein Q9171_005043 [Xanthocarpia ochracea]